MTESMMRAFAFALFGTMILALAGCPSKDGQSSSGGAMPSPGAGPLANLESAPFQNEVWVGQEGGQTPFIYYTQQNVRLSAQCRSAAGQMDCAALKHLRIGPPVAVERGALKGGVSAGVRACQKLGYRLWYAHNASGSEDGFCVFPDGSMVSTGALEMYGMRLTE
jgi:putative hemolysin